MLPEIGVVGDIVATSSEEKADAEGNDRIAVRELELVLSSNVDPYSRFDANIAFSDFEEVSVEEAYLTRWGLPAELTARFGQFFPKVGKQASTHRDSLPTMDEPLVIRRYFGVEGYNKTGVDVTRLFDGPWSWVLSPRSACWKGGRRGRHRVRREPPQATLYSHLKTYTDLGIPPALNWAAHMLGSSDADSEFEVNVFGVDATYTNNLTPTSKLLLQSELFVQHRDESEDFNRHPWGLPAGRLPLRPALVGGRAGGPRAAVGHPGPVVRPGIQRLPDVLPERVRPLALAVPA